MKAIDLYYKAFNGTTLADLYRDKVETDLKTRGYKCSEDELLNFVDYKSEQLMLLTPPVLKWNTGLYLDSYGTGKKSGRKT